MTQQEYYESFLNQGLDRFRVTREIRVPHGGPVVPAGCHMIRLDDCRVFLDPSAMPSGPTPIYDSGEILAFTENYERVV